MGNDYGGAGKDRNNSEGPGDDVYGVVTVGDPIFQ